MDNTISRQEAIKEVLLFVVEYCGAAFDEDMQIKLKQRLENLPSIQPEIIYCGECKHMMPDGRCWEFADPTVYPSASDFCSRAERRADE